MNKTDLKPKLKSLLNQNKDQNCNLFFPSSKDKENGLKPKTTVDALLALLALKINKMDLNPKLQSPDIK